MAWAIWLAAPVAVTVLAALVIWWRGRPPRPLRTVQTMAGHRAYLDALTPASAPESALEPAVEGNVIQAGAPGVDGEAEASG